MRPEAHAAEAAYDGVEYVLYLCFVANQVLFVTLPLIRSTKQFIDISSICPFSALREEFRWGKKEF